MFKHPKYYQELAKVRKQLEKEQARKLASEQAGGRVGPKATSTQATSDQASSGSRTNKR
jgi:hypothetical protein